MGDAIDKRRFERLLIDGTVDALNDAVRLLVRRGGCEVAAQRRVWGLAPYDVATVRKGKQKIHLVRYRNVSVYVGTPDRSTRSYCGKDLEVTPGWEWGPADGFELRLADAPAGADYCKTCSWDLRQAINRYTRLDPEGRVVRLPYRALQEVQLHQCAQLRVMPYTCRRGEHYPVGDGAVCRGCFHVGLPLFGRV